MLSYDKLSDADKKKAQDMGYSGIFASRETIGEAIEYFNMIIESLPPSDRIAVITAVQVVENTKILSRLSQ